jgi:diadenosine tetraphosphate (Ap4A) HIT family hydrolase
VLGVAYVGEKIIGIDVPHAHVHLIPFNIASEYLSAGDMSAEPDHVALAAMAERLAF